MQISLSQSNTNQIIQIINTARQLLFIIENSLTSAVKRIFGRITEATNSYQTLGNANQYENPYSLRKLLLYFACSKSSNLLTGQEPQRLHIFGLSKRQATENSRRDAATKEFVWNFSENQQTCATVQSENFINLGRHLRPSEQFKMKIATYCWPHLYSQMCYRDILGEWPQNGNGKRFIYETLHTVSRHMSPYILNISLVTDDALRRF
jgi:hypothetical protein